MKALLLAAILIGSVLMRPDEIDAQILAVSPRVVWMDAYSSPRRSVTTGMAGVRVTSVQDRLSPFGGIYWRTTEVAFIGDEPPPSDGIHAVLGVSVQGGKQSSVRPHAALGAGMVFWKNQNWGENLFGELEAGFTFPLSANWGIVVAGRVERTSDEPTLWGGTLGMSFQVGN